MHYSIKPVAFVRNTRSAVEDDYWGTVLSTIELAEDLHEEALAGIGDFSHLDIIFYFDQVADEKIQYEARHPRNNDQYPKVGIFAQRGKNRPNKLGLTTVTLREVKKRSLLVCGLDAVDGTPIIDIKPVMAEFLPKGKVTQPEWSIKLMENYWS